MRTDKAYSCGVRVLAVRPVSAVVGIATLLAFFLIAQTAAGDEYGAISYSPEDRAYGFSVSQPSQELAEQKALEECRSRGGDCRSPVWFVNACGAVAVATNGSWGQDWGHTKRQAIKKATDLCTKYGGEDCKELVSICCGR